MADCVHDFSVPIESENLIKNAQGEIVPTHGQPDVGFPNYTMIRKLMCSKGCGATKKVES